GLGLGQETSVHIGTKQQDGIALQIGKGRINSIKVIADRAEVDRSVYQQGLKYRKCFKGKCGIVQRPELKLDGSLAMETSQQIVVKQTAKHKHRSLLTDRGTCNQGRSMFAQKHAAVTTFSSRALVQRPIRRPLLTRLCR